MLGNVPLSGSRRPRLSGEYDDQASLVRESDLPKQEQRDLGDAKRKQLKVVLVASRSTFSSTNIGVKEDVDVL